MRLESAGGLDVYAVDLYTPKRCRELRIQCDALPAVAPNSMNKYGKLLVGPEMHVLMHTLVASVVSPVARARYPEIAVLKKQAYGFVVDYDVLKQRSLAKHEDSSDVTLNLCLSEPDDYEGGELVFYGKNQTLTVPHKLGRALIHRGSLTHRALPLRHGKRTNMILWCRARGSTW